MKHVNSYISGLAAILLLTTGCNRADSGQMMNESTAENRYELLIAQADAERKVALEQCEALSGSAQEACKESADAQYELSKAEAERQRGGM